MKRPTKSQVALGLTQFVTYMLVCFLVILPLIHDFEGWAWWKHLVFIIALLAVARAVDETVLWLWDMGRQAVAAWRKK